MPLHWRSRNLYNPPLGGKVLTSQKIYSVTPGHDRSHGILLDAQRNGTLVFVLSTRKKEKLLLHQKESNEETGKQKRKKERKGKAIQTTQANPSLAVVSHLETLYCPCPSLHSLRQGIRFFVWREKQRPQAYMPDLAPTVVVLSDKALMFRGKRRVRGLNACFRSPQ